MRRRQIVVSALLWLAIFWVGPTSSAKASIYVQWLWIFPPAGELIERPTLTVVVDSGGAFRQQALLVSDGDLVLEPVVERDSVVEAPFGPVPLNVAKRHVGSEETSSGRLVVLELRPQDELVAGVKYVLRPVPGGPGEFIELDRWAGPRTGTAWTVVSDRESQMPSWKAGSPRVVRNELKGQGPVWSIKEVTAHLRTDVADAAAILLLGRNADGQWVTHGGQDNGRADARLPLFIGNCVQRNPGWTGLRTIEVVALGLRGERAESKLIPARANPVATSVLVGLTRIRHFENCSEDGIAETIVSSKAVKTEAPVPLDGFCAAFGQAACAWQQRCAPLDDNDACEEGFSKPCSAESRPKSRYVPGAFRYDDEAAASWLASLRDADCASDDIILAPDTLFHPLDGPRAP